MHRLEDLDAFIAVVEEGSLSAAARRLHRSLQSVSRSLAALERSIGAQLIRRTTRQSSQTEAGARFYSRVRPALSEITDAALEVTNQRSEPAGTLRITASALFAPTYLLPTVAEFMHRYSEVEIELTLTERIVDLVEENVDLAIRVGDLPDSGLKARRLGAIRRVVCGAPDYFARHGRPTHPEELTRHQCITRKLETKTEAWPFVIDGTPRTIRVTGKLRTDNTAVTSAAASLGLGVGFAPLWLVRDLVERGELEVILADFETPLVPINAVSVATKVPLPAARLFTDFLAQRLKSDLP
jgi:DNA-binding transcriptional LysR family regulator